MLHAYSYRARYVTCNCLIFVVAVDENSYQFSFSAIHSKALFPLTVEVSPSFTTSLVSRVILCSLRVKWKDFLQERTGATNELLMYFVINWTLIRRTLTKTLLDTLILKRFREFIEHLVYLTLYCEKTKR